MVATFIHITNINDINCSTIKELADKATSNISKEFIIKNNDIEIGFLSLEFWVRQNIAHIYEIYITPSHINMGHGKSILKFAENLALEQGYPSIQLEAHPFDKTKEIDFLIRWYARQGYTKINKNSFILQKCLSNHTKK